MARALIVGCGCRGRLLGGRLLEDGWAVRGTSRRDGGLAAIEGAGIEAAIADPDRPDTLLDLVGDVTVIHWLLGSAEGESDAVAAIHGPRLERFLEKLVDTPVRGFVYEAAGTVDPSTLARAAEVVGAAAETWHIPVELVGAEPEERQIWLQAMRSATRKVISLNSDRNSLDSNRRLRMSYAKDVLVETDWVAEHLDDDSIRIVEVDENPALYAEGHIPGAIGFDWRADLQDQVKRDFLGAEDFGALMGGRGISNDHTVVLYGDRNNWFAAYTYWYFRYYGHSKVKLVNGPREKWIAEGRETSTEAPSYPAATFTAAEGDKSIRAFRDEVTEALDSSTNLVDVRSPQEYSGELIAMPGYEQEGAQRAGHIPGAASVPWAQAVNEDGTFKSEEELRELYTGKGVISNGDSIIAYCRIGERSAHTWFVLHELLGQDDVKNYDGSWTEWGNLVGSPIEKDV